MKAPKHVLIEPTTDLYLYGPICFLKCTWMERDIDIDIGITKIVIISWINSFHSEARLSQQLSSTLPGGAEESC